MMLCQTHAQSSVRAVMYEMHEIKGKAVEVKAAEPKEARPAAPSSPNPTTANPVQPLPLAAQLPFGTARALPPAISAASAPAALTLPPPALTGGLAVAGQDRMSGNLPFGNEHAAALSLSAPPDEFRDKIHRLAHDSRKNGELCRGREDSQRARGGAGAVPFARVDMVLSQQVSTRPFSAVSRRSREGRPASSRTSGCPGASAFFMLAEYMRRIDPSYEGRPRLGRLPWGYTPGRASTRGKRAPVPVGIDLSARARAVLVPGKMRAGVDHFGEEPDGSRAPRHMLSPAVPSRGRMLAS